MALRDEASVAALLPDPAATGPVLNNAMYHAMEMMKTESARVDADLADDFGAVLRGQCVYLNGFVCGRDDDTLFEMIREDLVAKSGASLKEGGGLVDWSKHKLYENPTDVSPTFNAVVTFMAAYFDVDIYATRLNYYTDGKEWKPFHHDSHAYGGRALREDFTVGISLGATRELAWLHPGSGKTFSFPQHNGDCFAFTNEVNTRFQHGVPRSTNPHCGPRISIIAWGRRRSITPRNGGPAELPEELRKVEMASADDAVAVAKALVAGVRPQPKSMDKDKDKERKKKKRLQ